MAATAAGPPSNTLTTTATAASDPAPIVNLARDRAAYQSSSADDDHTAHLATDGSDLTYWECKPAGEQWISVDLGEALLLDHVTLHWAREYPRSYRIEVSRETDRPQHWETVFHTEDGRGGVETMPLTRSAARYVRLAGMNTNPAVGFSLAEFEVWGTRAHARSRPKVEVLDSGSLLADGWRLRSSLFETNSPKAISSTGYDDAQWLPAIVPGTVLASYLAAGAIPDPNFGNQQSQISDDFFTGHDFWYRNTFVLASNRPPGRLWLGFDGINWTADVYLNGVKLGGINGAFLRGRLEMTRTAVRGGTNCLAVLIHRVAHPGQPRHKLLGRSYPNGGILGLDSPTILSSIGWNWLPTIRGRNVGIWNDVRIESSGDLILKDPWVSSELPFTDRAELTVRAEVQNLADVPKRAVLRLSMNSIQWRRDLLLGPHETKSVVIDKASCPGLALEHPQLWWPNGYGAQNLHAMDLALESDGQMSDQKHLKFGIRKMEYRVEDGQLRIYVNGCRILCRGGNWGMDEGLLRCDREGYDLRVKLHRDMNLVMIRNWVGMVGRGDFYDACDKYGLLVWDDFWLANPVDGPDPADHAMFMSNVVDKIRRVRGHPCEAIYCGRNEGYPPPDLDQAIGRAVTNLDGTRLYLPDSAAGEVTGHGPYDVKDPEWYFENRGRTFHSELGIVCVPPVESMRAMMPGENLWPINDMWAVHDYQTPRAPLYTARIEQRYGPATSIEDYCRKAQMVNMETAKAMFESLQGNQGGGLLLWMTQPAWPSLICQLYDYYFEPTAACFGTKKACEPLHILWDSHTDTIKVANDTITDYKGLTAEARVFVDLGGTECWQKRAAINAPATSAVSCFQLERPAGQSHVFFVKLALRRGSETLSENFYWSGAKGGSCSELEKLPRVALPASATKSENGQSCRIRVNVSNPTRVVALMIRLKVVRNRSGDRVLPAFYSDNYFSLLPGETREASVEFSSADLAGELPKVIEEGWNVSTREIPTTREGTP
jgi:hypothetical protein